MKRRQFLQAAALTAAGLSLSKFELPAIVPIERKGDPRLRLGCAAYSFRNNFAWMKGVEKRPAGKLIDMHGFIDICVANGCEGAELTSYFFKGGADDAYFLDLRRYAFLHGIAI